MTIAGLVMAMAIAIGFAILFSFAIAAFLLPVVAVVVPAILVLVSKRGRQKPRWGYAAACVVSSVTLLMLSKAVPNYIPEGIAYDERYVLGFAVWVAAVVAPWLLWLAFLVRNTDRNYGAAQR